MSEIRIETLGCRLNQIESESMARFFLDAGFSVKMGAVAASESSDEETLLCIVNTCAVTQKAEQKARRIIRLLLRKCSGAVILVTGCYAQLSALELEKIDERVVCVGGQIKSRISELPRLLRELINENEAHAKNGICLSGINPAVFRKIIKEKIQSRPVAKKDFPEDSFRLSTTSFLAHSRASLKIQDGCNNNCSFCTIHVARGHGVSLNVQTVIDRVRELERAGQDEVVLTTINIAQYNGRYGDAFCNFTQLLALLLKSTNRINFRISSLYPEIIDDDFCSVISDRRVRSSFHISVQSGSDRILGLMNRHYKAADVEEAVKRLRRAKESPFIACDIITGFPTEEDSDFKQTMELCRMCDFVWVHAFPFSERPGTAACMIKPKVSQFVSGQRARILTDWAIKQKIAYIESFVGKELELVLEPPEKSDDAGNKHGVYHGMTENFIHCELEDGFDLDSGVTKTVKVVVTKALADRIKKGGDIEAIAKVVESMTGER